VKAIVSRAPGHHRCEANSAVAEITAKKVIIYERKAFVTLSNMLVTVARCSKRDVFTTQPLPQLEKESLVVQTHSTCPSCLPANTTLVLEEGHHKASIRDVRSTDLTGWQSRYRWRCCRSSGASIVTRCGGSAFIFLSVLAVPPRQTEMAAPRR
jgi:hypothetical protein